MVINTNMAVVGAGGIHEMMGAYLEKFGQMLANFLNSDHEIFFTFQNCFYSIVFYSFGSV